MIILNHVVLHIENDDGCSNALYEGHSKYS